MNRSTRQIERDVERTRSEIEDTVDALREKMSLGQMVDEVTHYLRDSGGSEMLSNFTAQARSNPMPLALVGIGLAWLMSGRGQPSMGASTSNGTGALRGVGAGAGEAAASTKSRVTETGHRAGEAAASAKSRITETGHRAGEAVSSHMHQASEAAADTYGRVSSGAARFSGQAQRTVSGLIEDEPLILAGLGLAVGAAIGAMLPPTEAENRILGEKRDQLKHDVGEMAREELQKAKSVAQDAVAAAAREVENGGSPADTADRAAKSATRTAERSAQDKGLGSSPRKG